MTDFISNYCHCVYYISEWLWCSVCVGTPLSLHSFFSPHLSPTLARLFRTPLSLHSFFSPHLSPTRAFLELHHASFRTNRSWTTFFFILMLISLANVTCVCVYVCGVCAARARTRDWVGGGACECKFTCMCMCVQCTRLIVEVLLYVHRNHRLIRDGNPGRPPQLSHSS